MQQNHIHELAKTLPPPRRQNVACDACRSVHPGFFTPLRPSINLGSVSQGLARSGVLSCPGRTRYAPVQLAPVSQCTDSFAHYSARSVRVVSHSIYSGNIQYYFMTALYLKELSVHVSSYSLVDVMAIILTLVDRHYVQQQTSEKKRGTATRRTRTTSSNNARRVMLCFSR